MQTLNVDVAVIGAGTAGLNARRQVEEEGKRARHAGSSRTLMIATY